MPLLSLPRGHAALAVAVSTFSVSPAFATDAWADAVESYLAGEDANRSYADPATTLGSPERFTGESFGYPGVVSGFVPAFGTDEIVSIGRGGELVVRFDEPVTDDADNPFGIDLLVFGNAAFQDTFPSTEIVVGLFGADGGVIEVSPDGVVWTIVPDRMADGLFPTIGYLDSGPYDMERGAVESSFTRPVDPALDLDDFLGADYDEVLAMYDRSGGGAGVDLGALGLKAIQYVRITNAIDADSGIEIDAFSDVTPVIEGDVTGDGRVDTADILAILVAWGDCPDPPTGCPADLDGSGEVDFGDILVVLVNWS